MLSREGLNPGRAYIYVWNCNMGGFGPTCEPETRRPEGGVVVCED